MRSLLWEKLLEVLKAVAPLVIAVCVLQAVLVHAPFEQFLRFLIGSVLVVAGMWLLFIGIDLGILPMGRFIGAELPRKGSLALIVAVAFALGFATTVAEPDVLVLADQIDRVARGAVSGQAVLYATAAGVGVCTAVALARIVFGWPMKYLLAAVYTVALVMALFAPSTFVSLAFDGGSVTTGVLSAPVLIALSVGLATVLAGRSAMTDGFGILGFASVGPIIAILALGLMS